MNNPSQLRPQQSEWKTCNSCVLRAVSREVRQAQSAALLSDPGNYQMELRILRVRFEFVFAKNCGKGLMG